MWTLLLKFRIGSERRTITAGFLGGGPLFHRWLPDGERDAIVLDTGDSNADLKVCFERRGFVDDGWIRFDYERQEVDPEVIPTQAVLGAGPLIGSLEIRGLPGEQITPVRENDIGDAGYVALGKRVVKNLLYPHVDRFLSILRANYGQYWIPELQRWDSRKRSLGDYCKWILDLRWSLDGGETWAPFVPDMPRRAPEAEITLEYYRQYLTKQDWHDLAGAFAEGYEPPNAALILARAHGFFDQGDIRQAIIEGVSALEVAISGFMRKDFHNIDALVESLQAFWGLPLRTQMVVVATIFGRIPQQDIEDTIRVIDMRNKVVHEGWSPPDEAEVRFSGLRNTVAALVLGPRLRFPTASPAIAIMAAENWEKEAQLEDTHGG